MFINIVSHKFSLEPESENVAFDDLRDTLSAIFGLSKLKLLEQAPRSPEYVPDPMELEDHVPVYIPEPEHPEDLVPAEDEAPTPPLPPFFLSPRIRPPHLVQHAADGAAAPSPIIHTPIQGPHRCYLYPYLQHPLAGTRADIPRLTHRLGRDYYLLLPDMGGHLEETWFRDTKRWDDDRPRGWSIMRKDRAAVRAEIEVLRRERLAYEQEKSIQTRLGAWLVDVTVWDISGTSYSWPWRLEHALTHWRTLVAVPRLCVKASKPKTMQEAIEFTTELMDEKTHAYAERQAEKKRRDCRSRPANANNNNNNNNNRNNNNNNQKGNSCYECGAQGHFRRNCPKLRNNYRGNQAGNDRAPAKVYVVGNAEANPDNVVAGMFLLNNRYAYVLFDTSDDRSFVSIPFSYQIESRHYLDYYFDVE
ncbi:putative reverse transcriptase domain-containing protein [Tanacetum coccineum]